MRNLRRLCTPVLRYLVWNFIVVEIFSRKYDLDYDADLEHVSNGPRIHFRKPRISMHTLNTVNAILPPIPTAWPPNFSILYLSNVTSLEEMDSGDAVKGIFSYSIKSGLRITHGPGGLECHDAFQTADGCSVQLDKNLIFVQYVTQNTGRMCCLNQESVSAVTREWPVHGFQYNSTKRIMSRLCHGYRRKQHPGFVDFVYWTDPSTHFPCAITIDNQPRLNMYFEANSWKSEEHYLSPSLRDDTNCEKPCPQKFSIPSIGLWTRC